MKKINPEILAEWESYRGKTITTATGKTFDKENLAQRAYSVAEGTVQSLQECIDKLEESNADQEHFHGETSNTVETRIIIARLEAEKFRFRMMTYRKTTWELGLADPLGSGLIGMLEVFQRSGSEIGLCAPQNDNEQDVSQKKKSRRQKAGPTT